MMELRDSSNQGCATMAFIVAMLGLIAISSVFIIVWMEVGTP